MKYLIAGIIVMVVVLGFTAFCVCVAASRSDERHEQILRRQWLEDNR